MAYTSDDLEELLNYPFSYLVRKHHGYLIGPGFDSYLVKFDDVLVSLYQKAYDIVFNSKYAYISLDYGIEYPIITENDVCLPNNLEILIGCVRYHNFIYQCAMSCAINQGSYCYKLTYGKDRYQHLVSQDDFIALSCDIGLIEDGQAISNRLHEFLMDCMIEPIMDRDLYVRLVDLNRFKDDEVLNFFIAQLVLSRYTR
jgi:hypothetical protein|nr:MAG TPA: hypothetical protein [Caudoviricetes sp.]